MDRQVDFSMSGQTAQTPMTAPTPTPIHQSQASYTPQQPQHLHQHSASPAPLQHLPPSQPGTFPPPLTPHASFTAQQPAPQPNQYSTPQTTNAYQQPGGRAAPSGYKAPPLVEAYCLNDQANLSIPEDVRKQFHRDEQGRVLFFTVPPLDPLPPVKDGAALGHSVRYLAAKAKREALRREKRGRDEREPEQDNGARKRARLESKAALDKDVAKLAGKAMAALEGQLADAVRADYRSMLGGRWQQGLDADLDRLAMAQDQVLSRQRETEEKARKRREKELVPLRGTTVFLDDDVA